MATGPGDTRTTTSAPESLLQHLAETMGDGVSHSISEVCLANPVFQIVVKIVKPCRLAQATAVSAKKALLSIDKPDKDPVNAERDCEKLWKRKGYTIPIEVQWLDHQDAESETTLLRTCHVKPQDWIKHWMETDPHVLCGCHNDPESNLSAFWELFKMVHSDHVVFQHHGSRLNRTIPLCIHGDEGRAVKRTNFLVSSLESPLGSTADLRVSRGCDCEAQLAKRPSIPTYDPDMPPPALDPDVLRVASQQLTNFKGHSYVSRMLIFGIGGWVYKKHPHIIDTLYEELKVNMSDLFYNGVKLDNGTVFYGACVGIKGDMDYHAKIFKLERSYSHVGTKNELDICHLCHAGRPGCKFEDFSESPVWLPTALQTRPWDLNDPPSLVMLPCDQAAPERILQNDVFHMLKLGVGRDIVGGVLVILLRLKFFDYEGSSVNLPDRFVRAHSYFAMWAKATNHSPGLRSFSKAYFCMKTLISAPWSNSKASDTVLLLKWLVFTLNYQLQHPAVPGHEKLLKEMRQVCQAALDISLTTSHGLWLKRPCARLLYANLMTMLRGYSVLAQRSLALRIRAFIQKPKGHGLHHIAVDLRRQLLAGSPLILSPQCYACDVNEDFVGRISKLSRQLGFRGLHIRVIQRYFLKVAALHRKRQNLKLKKKR